MPADLLAEGLTTPIRLEVTYRRRQVRLSVLSLGLACCAVEVAAAALRTLDDAPEPPAQPADAPPEAQPALDVLVVAGTVTDKLAPAVRRAYDEAPKPAYVISFGACSNTGGPYWDSYCVTKGVDQLLPVDLYVPGCPPRPEALLDALARLTDPRLTGAIPDADPG